MILVDDQIPYLAQALSIVDKVIPCNSETLTRDYLRRTRATAIFVRSVTSVDASLLSGTDVSFVGTPTAGIDHLDLEYLESRNIRFASAPGCNANAVAEYVLDRLSEMHIPNDATIGIVGFGHVGSLVARYARIKGMSVLVNDPPLVASGFVFPRWCTHADLADLMKRSNVITLHVPYTDEGPFPTKDLITAGLLSSCLPNACVINTARGGILDERPLADLVRSGHLSAVLDVFANEPAVDAYVTERVTFRTPHIAGYTHQAKRNGARVIFEAYVGKPFPEDQEPTSNAHDASPIMGNSLLENFEELRRLWPLRSEQRTPPTWDECDALDS